MSRLSSTALTALLAIFGSLASRANSTTSDAPLGADGSSALACTSAGPVAHADLPIAGQGVAGQGIAGQGIAGQWVADRADNICGLDDLKMLSNPVKVDYEVLLKATPEMKKMRDEKIDANSSEGIQLRQKAVDRIRDKADSVRQANGYCSVWKTVRHSDGRAITDITESVKALL